MWVLFLVIFCGLLLFFQFDVIVSMLGSIFQPPANSIGEEKAKYEGIAYKSEAVGLPETENQHGKNI